MVDRSVGRAFVPPGRLGPLVLPLLAAVVLGVLVWSEFETRGRQGEVQALLELESDALVEALGHAVEHTLASAREIEELASQRLLDQARLLDRLLVSGAIADDDLPGLAADLNLSRMVILDHTLRTEMEFPAPGVSPPPVPRPDLSAMTPLVRGAADEMILTSLEDAEDFDSGFAAAVRRAGGGAILLVMDARQMLAFRESVGALNLMQGVAATGAILYASLERSDGEIVAAVGQEQTDARGEVLELTRPVELTFGEIGKLRLGVSSQAAAAAAAAGRRRALVAALVTFVLAGATAAYWAARRRAVILRGESSRARSLTDAVLEGVRDAVLVTDPERVIRMVNPAACRLFGRPASELVGRPCAETPCAQVSELVEEGEDRELVLRFPDRPPVPALASVSSVRDDDGAPFGSAVLLRDLSEVKRLEQEARRTESLAAFGRLAAAVAHEVRNPLNAISLGVQRLERELPEATFSREHRHMTVVLREEVKRLDAIVGRLLDLARPPRLDPKPGDLTALVREMVPLFAAGLPSGVRLVNEGEALRPVLFDPSAVRQIVHNLVRNAAEAIRAQGTICINTRLQGHHALLEVTDDGPGIPPENLERIFELGFSTKPKGNGLGLPIVHRLATEMGGRITIESQPGRGTSARLLLPFAAMDSAA